MSDFLDTMAASSRARVPTRPPSIDRSPPVPLVLGRFGVIAEIKPMAPSTGVLGDASVDACVARAIAYARGGAACLSVLTEPTRFGGSLGHLEAVATRMCALGLPVMRKDFLVDPRQVVEARAAGASGVLLVARMLDDALLAEMIRTARSLGLFALVEAFDEADLERIARTIEPGVFVGVNCRDLRTLAIDRTRFAKLAPHLPPEVDAIAESGIACDADARTVAHLGYRGVLVGTSAMRANDPTAFVRALRDAGSEATCAT